MLISIFNIFPLGNMLYFMIIALATKSGNGDPFTATHVL